MPQLDFTGEVAIVTGGSSGIGAEIVKYFARAGANVVLSGRNAENLKSIEQDCIKDGANPNNIRWIEGDIREESTHHRIADCAISTYGKIDILVNNAAILYLNPVSEFTFSEYDEIMDVNMGSVFKLSSICIPHLKKTKGNIVNISSVAGVAPIPTLAPYCISKAALDMFTKCAALELGPFGIRVNTVAPGPCRTNIQRNLPAEKRTFEIVNSSEKAEPISGRNLPLGRFGLLPEVADGVLFIASKKASYITGAILTIDGGFLVAP